MFGSMNTWSWYSTRLVYEGMSITNAFSDIIYHNFGILEASAGNYEYDLSMWTISLWPSRYCSEGQFWVIHTQYAELRPQISQAFTCKHVRKHAASKGKPSLMWNFDQTIFWRLKSSVCFCGIFSRGQFWVLHSQCVGLCGQISQEFTCKRLQRQAISFGKPSLILNFGQTIFWRLKIICLFWLHFFTRIVLSHTHSICGVVRPNFADIRV